MSAQLGCLFLEKNTEVYKKVWLNCCRKRSCIIILYSFQSLLSFFLFSYRDSSILNFKVGILFQFLSCLKNPFLDEVF